MKKILSLFLLFAVILSLFGCAAPSTENPTVPVTTAPATQPATQPAATEPAEKTVIPYLIGKDLSQLSPSEDYVVVESGQEHSSYPEGTIIRQEPEGGAWVDKGTTVYVVTSMDQPASSEQPPVTEPIYWEPSDREDDPPRQDADPTEPQPVQPTEPPATEPAGYLDPDGSYTTKNDVALYIHLYGKLPGNFITKNQAENLYGKTNGLNKYGKCIGGDRFYNREGKLPGGYTYYECDIDTLYSSKRGAKRLVFTYSGIVYYTSDHYETFTRLY